MSQGSGHCMPHRVTRKVVGFGQVAEDKNREKVQTRDRVGISVGKARYCGGNSLRLGSFNNSCGLWAREVLSSHLVPSPGMI